MKRESLKWIATGDWKMRLVVYTAISDNYDELKTQPPQPEVDYVAFVDGAHKPTRPWRLYQLPAVDSPDPCRRAKFPKILSHIVLPDAEYSLWIDGAVRLIGASFALPRLIERYLAKADLAILRHPARDCLYAEAAAVLKGTLDDPQRIQSAVSRYRADGYPERAGLAEARIIVRRHTPAVAAFNEAWWNEIERGSRRDQISFPYVAWKVGLKYALIPLSERRGFHRSPHRRRRALVRGVGR